MPAAAASTQAPIQALLQPAYGDERVLELKRIDRPTPGEDDVLVRVRAAALNFGDAAVLTGKPYLLRAAFGLRRPKRRIAGMDMAGVVEAVGAKVEGVKVGDEVFGELSRGTLAELTLAKATELAPKPATLSFAAAAATPVAGGTALLGLRDAGGVQAGQRVVINGASGGVGTFAVQIAAALGAEVTAVCSTGNCEQALALGAQQVIDYTKEDYTQRARDCDVLFDLVGNHSLAARRRVLKPGGVYVASFGQGGGTWFGPLGRIAAVGLASIFARHKLVIFAASPNRQALLDLGQLLESGEVKPVVEQRFALADAPAAYRRLLEGRARGKLVIELAG